MPQTNSKLLSVHPDFQWIFKTTSAKTNEMAGKFTLEELDSFLKDYLIFHEKNNISFQEIEEIIHEHDTFTTIIGISVKDGSYFLESLPKFLKLLGTPIFDAAIEPNHMMIQIWNKLIPKEVKELLDSRIKALRLLNDMFLKIIKIPECKKHVIPLLSDEKLALLEMVSNGLG